MSTSTAPAAATAHHFSTRSFDASSLASDDQDVLEGALQLIGISGRVDPAEYRELLVVVGNPMSRSPSADSANDKAGNSAMGISPNFAAALPPSPAVPAVDGRIAQTVATATARPTIPNTPVGPSTSMRTTLSPATAIATAVKRRRESDVTNPASAYAGRSAYANSGPSSASMDGRSSSEESTGTAKKDSAWTPETTRVYKEGESPFFAFLRGIPSPLFTAHNHTSPARRTPCNRDLCPNVPSPPYLRDSPLPAQSLPCTTPSSLMPCPVDIARMLYLSMNIADHISLCRHCTSLPRQSAPSRPRVGP